MQDMSRYVYVWDSPVQSAYGGNKPRKTRNNFRESFHDDMLEGIFNYVRYSKVRRYDGLKIPVSKQWNKGSLANFVCEANSVSKQDIIIMVTCPSKVVQWSESMLSKLATFPFVRNRDIAVTKIYLFVKRSSILWFTFRKDQNKGVH